ncbi:MAG: patatin-like phospholipase family protein [Planctomycetes bacterium]|nr:patatin-like phospholipase family protein [Planctomycetota bacterium]
MTLEAPLKRGDRVILALGGGAARGMAHIGVCHVLEELGIEVAGVAGTSIGSAVGGVIAANKLAPYEEEMRRMTKKGVFSLLDPIVPRSGLFAGTRITDLMRDILGEARIEDCEIPYIAVAATLKGGEEVWIREGDLVDAMRASSSIPGVFTPVYREDRWLIDGGVSSPVPFAAASALGDLPVIAVDVNDQTNGPPLVSAPEEEPELEPQAGMLDRLIEAPELHPALREFAESVRSTGSAASERIAFGMKRMRDRIRTDPPEEPPKPPGMIESLTDVAINMMHQLASCQRELSPPDVMVIPRMEGVGIFDFHRTPELISEGERATREALGISEPSVS